MGGGVAFASGEPATLGLQAQPVQAAQPSQQPTAIDEGGPLAQVWEGMSMEQKIASIGAGIALVGVGLMLAPEFLAVGSVVSVASEAGTLATVLGSVGLGSKALGLGIASVGAATAAGATLSEWAQQMSPVSFSESLEGALIALSRNAASGPSKEEQLAELKDQHRRALDSADRAGAALNNDARLDAEVYATQLSQRIAALEAEINAGTGESE